MSREPYVAPLHFAVMNSSTIVDDRQVALWTEGCRQQLIRDLCPAWGLTPPGAAVYLNSATFPAGTALIAMFVDDIGESGVLGEHGLVGNIPYVEIDAGDSERPSTTLSHELCEATVNQFLNRWTDAIITGGAEYRYPLEVGDPVEASSYLIDALVMGEVAQIEVSNFVWPSWFDPASHSDKFDQLAELRSPLEIAEGGYAAPMINDKQVMIGRRRLALRARKFFPWSRTARLMRQKRIP